MNVENGFLVFTSKVEETNSIKVELDKSAIKTIKDFLEAEYDELKEYDKPSDKQEQLSWIVELDMLQELVADMEGLENGKKEMEVYYLSFLNTFLAHEMNGRLWNENDTPKEYKELQTCFAKIQEIIKNSGLETKREFLELA